MQRGVRRLAATPVARPRFVFTLLASLTLVAAVIAICFPTVISHSVFVPLLVGAGLFLSAPWLNRAVAVVLVGYLVVLATTWNTDGKHLSVAAVMATVLTIFLGLARRREGAGVALSDGSLLLADLRERLDIQAQIPALPEHFHVEACVLPASGGSFSGDFVVAARRGDQLDVALTDVSGNGPTAGMRALLLSGALSGLLGETEPGHFLPAANRYLIRQGWRDGFASAVHVSMNLIDGAYCIGAAGHPAAAHYHAGSRRWRLIDGASGLLLGLFEQDDEDYVRASGVLEPGDVLLLYTDGVVEGPDGDLTAGTQQMMAMAQSAMSRGLGGSAERICQAAAHAGGIDDRSVVMVWRTLPEHADDVSEALRDAAAGRHGPDVSNLG